MVSPGHNVLIKNHITCKDQINNAFNTKVVCQYTDVNILKNTVEITVYRVAVVLFILVWRNKE